jgi:hypothetical protein
MFARPYWLTNMPERFIYQQLAKVNWSEELGSLYTAFCNEVASYFQIAAICTFLRLKRYC